MLTTPKLKELQRPILIRKLALLPATSTQSFMQLRKTVTEKCHLNVMPCVTTFTMPVHLHGAYFASFLLLTGRCYNAETSVILLLLDRAFA